MNTSARTATPVCILLYSATRDVMPESRIALPRRRGGIAQVGLAKKGRPLLAAELLAQPR
jgi:hypothetical protein